MVDTPVSSYPARSLAKIAGVDSANRFGLSTPSAFIAANEATAAEVVNRTTADKLISPRRLVDFSKAVGLYDAKFVQGIDTSGASDVTALVTAAINEARSSGKVCYFDAGNYRLDTTCEIAATGRSSHILCHPNAIFVKSTTTAAPLMRVLEPYCVFEGVNWQYTGGTTPVDGNHNAVFVNGIRGTRFVNCNVRGSFYVGFYGFNDLDTTYVDCLSKGTVNRAFYAAFQNALTPFGNITYFGCVADGAVAEGSAAGVTAYGFNINGFGTGTARRVSYNGCLARFTTAHGYGIGDRIDAVDVVNCVALGGPYGFLFQFGNGFAPQRSSITGSHAYSCETGFFVNQGSFVSLNANRADLCTTVGFQTAGSCDSIQMNNNSVNGGATGFVIDNIQRSQFIGNQATQCALGFQRTSNTFTSLFVGNHAVLNTTNSSLAGTGHTDFGNLWT